VENEFNEPTDPDTLRDSVSRIVIDANLSEGFNGLHPGDEAMVVFSPHQSQVYNLLQHPRGGSPRPKQRGLRPAQPYSLQPHRGHRG